jgi:hypothetical protein
MLAMYIVPVRAGLVARMGEMRYACRSLVGRPEEKKHLGDLILDGQNRVSADSIATRLRAGLPGFDSRQEQRIEFFYSPPRQDRLWGPLSLPLQLVPASFPQGKAARA